MGDFQMKCSYIVAIDNTYSLTTNFLEPLLNIITENDSTTYCSNQANSAQT